VSLCGADMTEINAAVNKYNLELGEENLILEEKLTAIYEEIKDNSKVSDPNLAYVIGMRGNTDKEKIIAAITAFHDSSLVEYSLSEPGGSLPSN
jgi:exonuclease I